MDAHSPLLTVGWCTPVSRAAAPYIPDIPKKMLIQVLRSLEASALDDRKVYPVVLPKTKYTLTATGMRLHEPAALLRRWAAENTDLLEKIEAQRP